MSVNYPVTVVTFDDGRACLVDEGIEDGGVVASTFSHDIAHDIARRLNSHDDLLAALLAVKATDDHADPEVRAMVRAAIAKAEGGAQ